MNISKMMSRWWNDDDRVSGDNSCSVITWARWAEIGDNVLTQYMISGNKLSSWWQIGSHDNCSLASVPWYLDDDVIYSFQPKACRGFPLFVPVKNEFVVEIRMNWVWYKGGYLEQLVELTSLSPKSQREIPNSLKLYGPPTPLIHLFEHIIRSKWFHSYESKVPLNVRKVF